MKRIAAITVVLVVLLSGVGASASSSLHHQLLTPKEVPGWAKYYIAKAQTQSCPESTFDKPSNASAIREVFANRSSETLLLEKLVMSSDPCLLCLHQVTVIAMTKRHWQDLAATFDGQVTFQRKQPVNLGRYSVPVKGYTIAFVLGGANVTGVIAYAKKGRVVLALAEITLTELSARQFKATLRVALSRIS